MSLKICLPTPADGRLGWLCLVDTGYQQGACNPCLHREWEWVTQSVHSTASFCFWDNSRKAGFDFLNLLIYPSRGKKKINATITLGSHLSSAELTWQMPICLDWSWIPNSFFPAYVRWLRRSTQRGHLHIWTTGLVTHWKQVACLQWGLVYEQSKWELISVQESIVPLQYLDCAGQGGGGMLRAHKITQLKCAWRLKGSFHVKVLFIQRESLA